MTLLEGQVALAFLGLAVAVLAASALGQYWAARHERQAKRHEPKPQASATAFEPENARDFARDLGNAA